MTDMTKKALVYMVPPANRVVVERHEYMTPEGPLAFDLYRAALPSSAVVILVSGYPDPGIAAMLGKPLMDWISYQQWARLIAASGVNAVTYLNRTPADVFALIHCLRAAPLSLERLAVWSCSGNVPNALEVVRRARVTSAAFLYPFLLDVDGATHVADAATMFRFARPHVVLEDLAATPLLLVRAGCDTTPGLTTSFDRFVEKARARNFPLTVIEHPTGPHAFDVLDDSPRSGEVIAEVIRFLQCTLS